MEAVITAVESKSEAIFQQTAVEMKVNIRALGKKENETEYYCRFTDTEHLCDFFFTYGKNFQKEVSDNPEALK